MWRTLIAVAAFSFVVDVVAAAVSDEEVLELLELLFLFLGIFLMSFL